MQHTFLKELLVNLNIVGRLLLFLRLWCLLVDELGNYILYGLPRMSMLRYWRLSCNTMCPCSNMSMYTSVHVLHTHNSLSTHNHIWTWENHGYIIRQPHTRRPTLPAGHAHKFGTRNYVHEYDIRFVRPCRQGMVIIWVFNTPCFQSRPTSIKILPYLVIRSPLMSEWRSEWCSNDV